MSCDVLSTVYVAMLWWQLSIYLNQFFQRDEAKIEYVYGPEDIPASNPEDSKKKLLF